MEIDPLEAARAKVLGGALEITVPARLDKDGQPRRLRPSRRPHYDNCPICQQPGGVAIFQEKFLEHLSMEKLAEMFEATNLQIRNHVSKFKLADQKKRNRRAVLERIIAIGMDQGVKLKVEAKDVQKAVEHLDKLDGLIIERKEIHGPPKITLIGVPRAGGVMGNPAAAAIKGEVVKVGPPKLSPAPDPQTPEKETVDG